MKVSTVLKTAFLMVNAVWWIWLCASICDVGFNNDVPNPTYQEWNLLYVGDAS